MIAAGLGSDSWEVIINNVGLVACDFILERGAAREREMDTMGSVLFLI